MSTKQQKSRPTERNAENIQVVVRCRPLNKTEILEKQIVVCHASEEEKEVLVQSKANKSMTKSFFFDAVYGTKSTQRDIYQGTVLPIVEEVLEGYNCTLFAYGQTGTGKTYTMEGPKDSDPAKPWKTSSEAGVIVRSINTIFDHLHKCGDEYSVKVSHLELYNEELCDLLNTENKSLKIYEDTTSSSSAITVHNLTEIPVYNADDIFAILEKGWNERRTAETDLNKSSSRSHCIFSVTILIRETTPEGEEVLKVGKLNLVDLAGSENIGKSGARSQAKTEAGMINKSLLTLGRVITALTEHSPHVPYRESKLTRLLQDSLGGTTKTCIIATVSPASGGIDETLSTLDYAFRAKNIRNQPQVNRKVSKREVLREYTVEISELRAQLEAQRRKDGVFLPQDQFDKMSGDLSEGALKIEALEELIQIKEKEAQEMQEFFQRQSQELDKTKVTLAETATNLEKTSEQLKNTEDILETTKIQLTETQVVLAEYKTTEQQFHSEAEIVLGTLDITLGDIEGLHKKIDRRENLDESNRKVFEDLRKELLGRVHSAEDSVKSFISEQTTKYTFLSSTLGTFLTDKHQEIAQLTATVKTLNEILAQKFSQLNELTKQQMSQAQKQRDSSIATQENYQKVIQSQANTVLQTSNESSSNLAKQISTYKDSTTNWNETNKQKLQDNLQLTNDFVGLHTQALTTMQTDVDTKIMTGVDQLYSHGNCLAEFLLQQKSEEEKLSKTVMLQMQLQMQQMQQLLSNLAMEREQQVVSAISKMKEETLTTITGLSNLKSTLQNETDTLKHQIHTYNHQTTKNHTNLTTHTESNQTATTTFTSQAHHHIHQNSISLEKQVQSLNDSSASAVSLCKNQADLYYQSFVDFVGQHHCVVSDAECHASGSADVLCNAFQKVDGDLSDSTSKWLQQIGLGSEHAAQFLQHYNEYHYQHTSQCLLLGKFNCYIPTGTTPIRRHFDFPHNLTRTRPESEILSQYRNNRQLPDLSQDQCDLEEPGEEIMTNTPTDPDTSPDDLSAFSSKQSPRKLSKSRGPGPGRGGGVGVGGSGGDPKKTGKGSRGDSGRENGKRLPPLGKPLGRSSDSECPLGGTQKGTTTRTRLGELTNLVKI